MALPELPKGIMLDSVTGQPVVTAMPGITPLKADPLTKVTTTPAIKGIALPGAPVAAVPAVKATPAVPVPTEVITQVYTITTDTTGTPKLLYLGDRQWAKLTLNLETAGPVTVSTSSSPKIGEGSGIALQTNQAIEIVMAAGQRLYYASGAVSRVRVIIEPLPWGEQLALLLARK